MRRRSGSTAAGQVVQGKRGDSASILLQPLAVVRERQLEVVRVVLDLGEHAPRLGAQPDGATVDETLGVVALFEHAIPNDSGAAMYNALTGGFPCTACATCAS